MKMSIVVMVVIALIVGAGGFFAGMKYQESRRPLGRLGNFQGARNGQSPQQFRQGFRPVNGEILSLDDKSITVKLQDGSSKIVLVSDTTSIYKASEGIKDDLKVGERVAVFGQENSDGSVTAQTIQLGQVFRGATPGSGQ